MAVQFFTKYFHAVEARTNRVELLRKFYHQVKSPYDRDFLDRDSREERDYRDNDYGNSNWFPPQNYPPASTASRSDGYVYGGGYDDESSTIRLLILSAMVRHLQQNIMKRMRGAGWENFAKDVKYFNISCFLLFFISKLW